MVEHGAVQELHVERTLERGLVGNVYLGKVSRVLPGMQSAFIDIGLERTAFLHVADIVAPFTPGSRPSAPRPSATAQRRRMVPIEKQVFEGQSLMVQVIKDPIGTKGARLSTQISIAGRLLVFLPQDNHVGVSQKIPSDLRDALRARMQALIEAAAAATAAAWCREHGGFILRTNGEDASDAELAEDIAYLRKTWSRIRERSLAHAADVAAAPGPEPAAARAARPDQRGHADASASTRASSSTRCSSSAREFMPQARRQAAALQGRAADLRPVLDRRGDRARRWAAAST